jgi:archaellum component FlaF (FlaF/FlaG flagellin family)
MDIEIEPPHHHHHKTGHNWLDKVLPVSAILISVISILIAFHHGKVMQELVQQNARLVAANSLPHLSLRVTQGVDNSGLSHFDFTARNEGVGPAEIRTLEMLYDGEPVRDSRELLRKCCGTESREYRWDQLQNRMLLPRDRLAMLSIDSRPAMKSAVPALYSAITQDRIEVRACYCSVFDECWLASSVVRARPQRVQSCPIPKVSYSH